MRICVTGGAGFIGSHLVELLVERAVKRQTGARGLGSALGRALEDAAFEAYSVRGAKAVRLVLEDDAILSEVSRGAAWIRPEESQ